MNHNKVIADAAKGVLQPLGLVRSGKSRLWYDDHGWWAIVVEFQPSSWSKGTYLNVGVAWLLFEAAHWHFDIGHREEDFVTAAHQAEFQTAIERIARQAAEKVRQYRGQFDAVAKACEHYSTLSRLGIWERYYAGVLNGLAKQADVAERHFAAILSEQARYQWKLGIHHRVRDLLRLLPEPAAYVDSVTGIVLRCRSQLHLEEMTADQIRFS